MDKFDEFLSKKNLLSLAVVRDLVPYCANAFYAYDPKNRIFIIASSKDSQHIKAILKNQKVAGTVALDTKIIGLIKGVQFLGNIKSANEEEREIYFKRFSFAKIANPDLFTISIEWMKLTDNSALLGKKPIWERK